MNLESFLDKYCEEQEFTDKKVISNEDPIDVIIPLINTNPLFKKNLYSFYANCRQSLRIKIRYKFFLVPTFFKYIHI